MPEDPPDVVLEFMRWITDHRIGGYSLGSDNPSVGPWTFWDLMVELYIFGNNDLCLPCAATIDKVYEQTLPDIPLRALVTDIVVLSHVDVEGLIDEQSRFGEGFHPDFITDLIKRLYRAAIDAKGFKEQRLDRSQWSQVTRCTYHVSEVAVRSNGQRDGN